MRVKLFNTTTKLWLAIPSNVNIIQRMKVGCTIRPVAASVTARQASKMLALLWSRRLLFTAIITNTFNETVNGQVMLLTVMFKIKVIQTETGRVGRVSCPMEVLEKLDAEKLVMVG